MISLEDFTALVEGGEVPLEGRVEICPRCSRSGIRRRAIFVHVQTTEILGDGMLTVPRDSCRLSSKRWSRPGCPGDPPPENHRCRIQVGNRECEVRS